MIHPDSDTLPDDQVETLNGPHCNADMVEPIPPMISYDKLTLNRQCSVEPMTVRLAWGYSTANKDGTDNEAIAYSVHDEAAVPISDLGEYFPNVLLSAEAAA